MTIRAKKRSVAAAIILVLLLISLRILSGSDVLGVFILSTVLFLLLAAFGLWVASSGWRRPLAWTFGFAALMVAWWHQPYFGANVCPTKGLMWDTDFVEELRPTFRTIVERYARRREQGELPGEGGLPAGLTIQGALAVVDQAVDLFKQCVAARGLRYCRYVGPDENGQIFMARTNQGPGAIAAEEDYRYRLVRKDVNYEMAIIPTDASDTGFYFRMWQDGTTLGWGREGWGAQICDLGCFCDVEYGLR